MTPRITLAYTGAVIARRITPPGGTLPDSIYHSSLRAPSSASRRSRRYKEAEICQRSSGASLRFKIAFAIAVENFADARVACKKDRANVLVLRPVARNHYRP